MIKKNIPAFIFGILFAWGLGIAGMTQPQKIIGFLDIFGNWDPTLLWVMVGAILVHSVTFWMIKRRPSPILSPKFLIPTRTELDAKLIGGAMLFGLGWGIAGYCPGPALASLVTLNATPIIFFAAMMGGMGLFKLQDSRTKRNQT